MQPAEERRRGLDGDDSSQWRLSTAAFRVVLILLALSTLQAIYIATVRKEAFVAAFPGAVGAVYGAMLGVACGGLVAVVALWRWRAWGLVLFLALGISALVLDFLADAPMAHRVASASATVVVTALAFLVRDRFGRGVATAHE